jgi:hypothetical protein
LDLVGLISLALALLMARILAANDTQNAFTLDDAAILAKALDGSSDFHVVDVFGLDSVLRTSLQT